MSCEDFNYQNPSRNPFSDFVFDWKSEDPDLPIERTLRVLKQATVDNLPVGVRWISGLI